MTFHAFLGILSAVITGLAVVKVLQGILWMIHGRGQIKVYWVHLVWVGIAIFGAYQHFWNIVKQRDIIGDVDFYGIADMLWFPMVFYVFAGLLFPGPSESHLADDRSVDLQEFYYKNHAWLFGTLILLVTTNAGNLRRIVTQPLESETLLAVLPGVLWYGVLAVTRNKWAHMATAALVPLFLLFMVLFVGSAW